MVWKEDKDGQMTWRKLSSPRIYILQDKDKHLVKLLSVNKT